LAFIFNEKGRQPEKRLCKKIFFAATRCAFLI
jgi:hypothetical protein